AVVLQPNGAADDMRIAAKLILPEAIRHDHRVVFQVGVLARLIQTAEIRVHTERREEIFGYAGASDELRLALARPGKCEARDIFSDIRKRSVLVTKIEVIRARRG